MDECQLYSTLLELRLPWKVVKVSLDSMKKTVKIYIAHENGSKLLCPLCMRECMVYDHLRERVWRDLGSIEFMTFIHASPPRISCPEHVLRIRLRSDNKSMEKHLYKGRVKGEGVFNLLPIPEVTIW